MEYVGDREKTFFVERDGTQSILAIASPQQWDHNPA